jgi:succinate dehydrogenase flavin-adding protein (antitoxin of CptAB toxin-antitoxin module)
MLISQKMIQNAPSYLRRNVNKYQFQRGALSSIKEVGVTMRWYRGDSGEMTHRSELSKDKIAEREEKLLLIAKPKSEQIHERHIRMPVLNEIPKSSLHNAFGEEVSAGNEEIEFEVRKKRLIYRAKQRGWLEVDLLLGAWAKENVPTLTLEELNEFEDFVNQETIDIYNIITLRLDAPEEMKREDGNSIVERIQAWARLSPLGKADPETYEKVKRENNLI